MTLEEYRRLVGSKTQSTRVRARVGSTVLDIDPARLQGAHFVQPALPRPTAEPVDQGAHFVHPDAWDGDLPFPPSVNSYYRHVGAKVLISRKGRAYRKTVESILAGCARISAHVSFDVGVHPPDRRRRDLDNLLKCLQDSIVHGGLLDDDAQIRRLSMEMLEPVPGGSVHVRISEITV